MLNFIWSGFFLAAFAAALYQSLGLDNAAIWTELVNSTFASAKSAFQICLNLTGMLYSISRITTSLLLNTR